MKAVSLISFQHETTAGKRRKMKIHSKVEFVADIIACSFYITHRTPAQGGKRIVVKLSVSFESLSKLLLDYSILPAPLALI